SKRVLQSKLNLPLRRAGGVNPPGANVPGSVVVKQAGIGNAKVRMIRQVEELRTELDPLRLGYLEILAGRKIELRQAWANHGIPGDRAHKSDLITQVGPRHRCAGGKARVVVRCAWSIANAVHAGAADRRNEVVDVEPRVGITSYRIMVPVGRE